MTVAPLDPDVRPAPRLLPAPRHLPPYDDDLRAAPVAGRHLRLVAGQGELPLEWVLPSGVPARPDLPLVLLRGGASPDEEDEEDEDDFGPLPTPRIDLPAPGPWAGRLVQALVEVIGGDRPLSQLVRWTCEEVYEQVRLLASRTPGWPRRVRASVRSVHVAEPQDGVAEVCAVIHDGVRARAYALRLEGADGRWCCTQLVLV
jgi:hypothetical protein